MPAPRVEASRQPAGEPRGDVHGGELAEMAEQLTGHAGHPQREGQRLAHEAAVVRAAAAFPARCRESGEGSSRLSTRIISSGVMPLATMLRDEGARAGADVDVELVDRPVDGEEVEGAQGADLVHAAGEPTAAQNERGLRSASATSPAPSLPRLRPRGLELDDLPHGYRHYAWISGYPGPPWRVGAWRSCLAGLACVVLADARLGPLDLPLAPASWAQPSRCSASAARAGPA